MMVVMEREPILSMELEKMQSIMFYLDLENGWEFSFDVDLSRIPCAMNDALYFVEMEKDGGKSRGSQGPHFGTGYCDAQCPDDLHQVDGEANVPDSEGWAKRQ